MDDDHGRGAPPKTKTEVKAAKKPKDKGTVDSAGTVSKPSAGPATGMRDRWAKGGALGLLQAVHRWVNAPPMDADRDTLEAMIEEAEEIAAQAGTLLEGLGEE